MANEKLTFDVTAKASGTEDVRRLGQAIDDVGKSADDLGKKGGVGKGLFSDLEKEAGNAEKSIGSAFKNIFSSADKDADAAGKSIGSKLVGSLKGVASTFSGAGQEIGQALEGGIGEAFSGGGSLGTVLGPVLIGAAAAAAPAMGATLAAGITVALGAAGIGAGIALALQDPEIAMAAKQTGTDIMSSLKIDAEGFKQPVMDALTTLNTAFTASENNIRTIFANSAGLVAPLATSVGSALNSIIAGVANLSTAFAPVFSALDQGVQMLGSSIGNGLSSLADNGAAMATALTGAFVLIKAAIDATFMAVNILTESFGFLAEKGLLGPGIAASYQTFKSQVDTTKTSMDALGSSVTNTTSSMVAQSNELKAETDPIFGLMQAQQNLTNAQNTLNTAIKQHGANSTQAKAATTQLAGAVVDLQGKSANAAQAGFDGTLSPALQRAMSAAHLTKTQMDQVASSVSAAHTQLENYQGTYTATVITTFEQIGKPYTTAAGSTGIGGANFTGHRWGGIDYAMAGGGAIDAHFAKSPTVLYGERSTHGEAFIPRRGNMDRSRSIAEKVVRDWLGGSVSWDSNQPGTGGTHQTGPSARGGSGGDLGALIAEVRSLARAASRGGGDVYLDNRKVGYVQGRETSLYDRAG